MQFQNRKFSELHLALVSGIISLFVFITLNFEFFINSYTKVFNQWAPIQGVSDQVLTPDVAQMVYLVWSKSQNFKFGNLFIDDFMFANNKEFFNPLVTDPFVFFGGFLNLVLPLEFSYNLAQVYLPVFLIGFFTYLLLSSLNIETSIAIASAALAVFIPERLHMSASGQHIGASFALVPLFYWSTIKAILEQKKSIKYICIANFTAVLIALSEEHLAYYLAILNAWVFIVYLKARKRPKEIYASICIFSLSTLVIGSFALKIHSEISGGGVDSRQYPFHVIVNNSSSFLNQYITNPTAFNFGQLILILIGFYSIYRMSNSNLKRVNLGLTSILIFATVLSLGHIPQLAINGVDLYKWLFNKLPLFDMQRYPFRISNFSFYIGIVISAFGAKFIFNKCTRSRKYFVIFFAAFCAYSSYAWNKSIPYYKLGDSKINYLQSSFKFIRENTSKTDIIASFPSMRGASLYDAMTLLHIVNTNRRFANGYFSFAPETYLLSKNKVFKYINDNEDFELIRNELKSIGTTFLLIDKKVADNPEDSIYGNYLLRKGDVVFEDEFSAVIEL